jgi:prophage maintenance system killer protein
LYGLAKSQACPKGNKRVAMLLTRAFVEINGSRLETQPREFAELVIRTATTEAAEHETVVAELTVWMREHLREDDAL